MHIHIVLTDDKIYANCPFCNDYQKIEDLSLEIDDYVQRPMIWCDNCGSRAFLQITRDCASEICDYFNNSPYKMTRETESFDDNIGTYILRYYIKQFVVYDSDIDSETKVSSSDVNKPPFTLPESTEPRKLKEYYDERRPQKKRECLDALKGKFVVFKIPLAKVRKIVTSKMCGYYTYNTLTQEQVAEFIDSLPYQSYSEDHITLLKKYNIYDREMEHNIDPEIFVHNEDFKAHDASRTQINQEIKNIAQYGEKKLTEDERLKKTADWFYGCGLGVGADIERLMFNLGVDCNSYNVEDPATTYPNGVSTDHDGIYMHALIENVDGRPVSTCYWGD